MLFAIKDHIASHPNISLSELAQQFNTPPSAMQAMVAQWTRKGVVHATHMANGCGGGACGGCAQRCAVIHYRLID